MAAALAPSSEKRRNVGRPATTRALSPYKPKMATSAAVVNSKMLQVKETKIKGLESKIRELEATLVVTQVCSSTCMLVHGVVSTCPDLFSHKISSLPRAHPTSVKHSCSHAVLCAAPAGRTKQRGVDAEAGCYARTDGARADRRYPPCR